MGVEHSVAVSKKMFSTFFLYGLNKLVFWGFDDTVFDFEKMHLIYIDNMTTYYQRTSNPGGNEIYNFGRGFFDHHYFIFSLSILCPGVEKKNQ